MEKNSKIYLAGHNGLVGSSIARKLKTDGYTNVVTRKFEELDLRDATAVEAFFKKEKPEYVFLAAAKVGGILVNDEYGGDFIYDNLAIEMNIVKSSKDNGVKKLLFLGSSCIYPRDCPQPIKEEYFMTGPLEETNKPYAMAKIAGIVMCQAFNKQFGTNFISVMPTNLYGPGDNFDLKSSHVMPALIRKLYEAKTDNVPTVGVWGTGAPKREFLYVDDLADAVVFLMNNYDDGEIINIGTGIDVTIKELAETIKDVVRYPGKIVFDASKPDGTPRKWLDVSRLNGLGWHHRVELKEGIRKTVNWFCQMGHDQKR